MYCSYCGTKMDDLSKFCPVCGKNIEDIKKNQNIYVVIAEKIFRKAFHIAGIVADRLKKI